MDGNRYEVFRWVKMWVVYNQAIKYWQFGSGWFAFYPFVSDRLFQIRHFCVKVGVSTHKLFVLSEKKLTEFASGKFSEWRIHMWMLENALFLRNFKKWRKHLERASLFSSTHEICTSLNLSHKILFQLAVEYSLTKFVYSFLGDNLLCGWIGK